MLNAPLCNRQAENLDTHRVLVLILKAQLKKTKQKQLFILLGYLCKGRGEEDLKNFQRPDEVIVHRRPGAENFSFLEI